MTVPRRSIWRMMDNTPNRPSPMPMETSAEVSIAVVVMLVAALALADSTRLFGDYISQEVAK